MTLGKQVGWGIGGRQEGNMQYVPDSRGGRGTVGPLSNVRSTSFVMLVVGAFLPWVLFSSLTVRVRCY